MPFRFDAAILPYFAMLIFRYFAFAMLACYTPLPPCHAAAYVAAMIRCYFHYLPTYLRFNISSLR